MKLIPIGPNQTELHLNNGTIVLFSYKTPVAANLVMPVSSAWPDSREYFFIKTKEHYSKTTSKHVNQWLENKKVLTVEQSVLDNLVK